MRTRTVVVTLLVAALAPAPAALAESARSTAGALEAVSSPAAITTSDFLTQAQIRARLDLTRPLSSYDLHPTDNSPEPDPDCATNRPEATSSKVYPAQRSRTQVFEYQVPGAAWSLQGYVQVLEYPSTAKARAALARVVASVKSSTGYTLVCEAINPIVSGQKATKALAVPGTSFAWRYHLRAGRAGSWRDVIATRGRRVVWVELGREFRADLDWDSGTPPATFPKYPSNAYLQSLAQGAVAKGF